MIKLPKTLLLFSIVLFALLGNSYNCYGQSDKERIEIVKFGIGLRAVASSDLLSGGATAFQSEGVDFSFEPNLSRGIDALIRFKLKDRFSLQSGISAIRRSYNYGISTDTLGFSGSLIQTSFQIPITGLLQVQISDKMNVGTEVGLVAEIFPGDVAAGDEDHYALIYVQRRFNSSLKASALTNYELESGAKLEFGLTYQRLLGRLGSFYLDYEGAANTISTRTDLQGHFFSANIAFFFP